MAIQDQNNTHAANYSSITESSWNYLEAKAPPRSCLTEAVVTPEGSGSLVSSIWDRDGAERTCYGVQGRSRTSRQVKAGAVLASRPRPCRPWNPGQALPPPLSAAPQGKPGAPFLLHFYARKSRPESREGTGLSPAPRGHLSGEAGSQTPAAR